MKKTSKTIVFFGNERLATGVSTNTPTLQRLVKAGYDVKAVIAKNDPARSRNSRPLEIAEVAKNHNIVLLSPSKLSEIKQFISELNPSIGILVAYGKIVPQWFIDLFPYGIINIHPSLLPLHRGPTPIESTILENGDETGVSLMQLSSQMDAGPVYDQRAVKLTGTETKQDLSDLLLDIGAEMLETALPAILNGSLEPAKQNETKATYDSMIRKQDGIIRWNESAELIARKIRAYAYWPGSRTTLAGKDVIITQAHAVLSQPTGSKPGDITIVKDTGVIMIAASNGSVCIEKLKPAGKQEMTTRAFLAGHEKNLR